MSSRLKYFLIFLSLTTLILGIYSFYLEREKKKVIPISLNSENDGNHSMKTATIYIPDLSSGNLVADSVKISEVPSKSATLELTLSALIDTLKEKEIIGKKNYKCEVYLRDNTLYLDLDSKLFNNVKNAKAEKALLHSFTQTLLNASKVEKLIVLINGMEETELNYIKLKSAYKLRNS